MKTYKNFELFVRLRKGIEYDCVLDEAAKAGFSRFQIWFYSRCMKWKFAGRPRFYAAMRRAVRVVWWCLVAVGAFFWFQRVNKLMDTAIYRNQTEVARNALYSCQQMPEVCPSAAKLVKEVMK